MLGSPRASEILKDTWMNQCRESFAAMVRMIEKEEEEEVEETVVSAQADDLISIRQLRGTKVLGSSEIDIDDGDITRATGSDKTDFSERLNHVHQLSGFADPVYAEAYVTVHDYDIVLEILVINRTDQQLNNLQIELATMGDLKIVERPQTYTIGPNDQRTIKANLKVSSTETGHIFGTIVYDRPAAEDADPSAPREKVIVNLNDIHLDIMDYICPATCSDAAFRSMWAEFEWENKVAVNTSIDDVTTFLQHVVENTNMKCMTPTSALGGDCNFLAANLYAKSIFGEDALVNVSIEKQPDGKIVGYIRIRSKTQGIALSLGDRITAIQRG
jgi:coatomer subunit beta